MSPIQNIFFQETICLRVPGKIAGRAGERFLVLLLTLYTGVRIYYMFLKY